MQQRLAPFRSVEGRSGSFTFVLRQLRIGAASVMTKELDQ